MRLRDLLDIEHHEWLKDGHTKSESNEAFNARMKYMEKQYDEKYKLVRSLDNSTAAEKAFLARAEEIARRNGKR